MVIGGKRYRLGISITVYLMGGATMSQPEKEGSSDLDNVSFYFSVFKLG